MFKYILLSLQIIPKLLPKIPYLLRIDFFANIIIMWGIEFSSQFTQINLPMVTGQGIAIIAAQLLSFRIFIHYLLQRVFGIKPRKEHNVNYLQFSYFYHLAIIILSMPQLNWNMFDLHIWIFTYAYLGMVRKAIHTINLQKNRLLNDYAYNNQIMTILTYSRVLAYIVIPIGIVCIFWIMFTFLGVMFRVINLLCFPAVMLVVDSIFLLIVSWATEKHLVYYYNQNINQMPPTYKIQLFSTLVSSSIKIWHFYNLTMICAKTVFNNIDLLDCLWIISVLCSLYSSLSLLVTSSLKYNNMRKLNRNIDQIFKKVDSRNEQICIICMQPLLNCHQLITCGHIFHYKCFLQWVQTKQQCPVCRVRINFNV